MTRTAGVIGGIAVVVIVVVVVAVIAGGGDDDSGTASASPPKTASGATASIGAESNGDLGKILVDSRGRTVYLFEKDTSAKSTCSGACAVQWPPVTTKGKPTVGTGLTASKVGTTSRSDGTTQITYNGHPLYRFQGDGSAGDANGQGLNVFGASWFVVSPAGSAVTSSGAGSGRGY